MASALNNPFASWNADRLILCNYLRPKPHTYTVLTGFAGHKNLSLRVAANRLRQAGQAFGPRLTKENVVVSDHPANLALELFPLPDPPAKLPAPYSKQSEALKATAAALVQTALPDTPLASSAASGLSGADLIRLVDDYIRQGAGGRDFLKAIELRANLSNLDVHSGPPVPLEPAAQALELLALLKELPPDVCTEAWTHYCQHREALASDCPQSPDPDHPDLDEGQRRDDNNPDGPNGD